MPIHFQNERYRIHKIVASPMANNAYIIVCKATGESVIIDAPRDAGKIIEEVKGTRVRAILITHRHGDHLEGFEKLKTETKAAAAINHEDASAMPGMPDFYLTDGDIIPVGHLALKVIHTPGHTPGATCLLLDEHLFTGDTLFPGGPGRTHSNAELEQEIESITTKLYTLPDTTRVYPGHGNDTTIAQSKEQYAVFAGKQHAADLSGDVSWLRS